MLDILIPEQAIEVPKIPFFWHSRRRRVRFAEQTAEQLVEVQTIVSFSSFHGLVEQNVDIPVLHGRDRVGGGLLGLQPGQSSTAFGGAHYFQQRLPSRSLTFRFRVVAEFFILHRRLLVCRVRQIKGYFALFAVGKSVQLGPHPAVIVPGVWVSLMIARIVFFRMMSFFVGAMLGLTLDTCSASVPW